MDKGLVGLVYRVNPAGWPAILDDDPEECQQLISPKLEGVTMEVIICSSAKLLIQIPNLFIFPNRPLLHNHNPYEDLRRKRFVPNTTAFNLIEWSFVVMPSYAGHIN